MAAPAVQVLINDEKIRIAWEVDTTGTYRSFNLYWDTDSAMAAEALLKSGLYNSPDTTYSEKHGVYDFTRASIGLGASNEFYIRLKGVLSSGVEDVANPGPTKIVPKLTDDRPENNMAQIQGYDYTKDLWKKVKVNDDGSLDVAVTLSPGDIQIGAVEIKDHDSTVRANVEDVGGGDGALDVRISAAVRTSTNLFSGTVLTNVYQYSSSVSCSRYGQAILYTDYTKGTEASHEMKVQFSPDGATWFDGTYETLGTPTVVSVKEYQWTASAADRVPVPLSDMYMRVGIKATGAPSGTVSMSVVLGWN